MDISFGGATDVRIWKVLNFAHAHGISLRLPSNSAANSYSLFSTFIYKEFQQYDNNKIQHKYESKSINFMFSIFKVCSVDFSLLN